MQKITHEHTIRKGYKLEIEPDLEGEISSTILLLNVVPTVKREVSLELEMTMMMMMMIMMIMIMMMMIMMITMTMSMMISCRKVSDEECV